MVGGGEVDKIDSDSTGVNPAWRSALAHAYFTEMWTDGTPLDDINKLRDQLKVDINAMEQFSSASYFNEVRIANVC